MRRAESRLQRLPLTPRLVLALLLLAALVGLALWSLLVPRTAGAFVQHGEDLLQDGSATMRQLAEQQTLHVRELLQDLIRHSASARTQELADLPLELVGNDLEAIRAMIATADSERSERQQANVQRLLRELLRRADSLIEAELAAAKERQRLATTGFADQQWQALLVLVAAVLAFLLLVLGLGLHRLVIRPTQRLRAATQRVAAGDLEGSLPPPASGELGELAADFGAMVAQLRVSRAELQQFASRLEEEVARKTAHLQQALEELQRSHQQLAKAERLAALGTLAGGIAHEFHNLIGGMRGCAQELAADSSDPEQQATLGVILRAADRATGVVQQLLRFARPALARRSRVDLVQLLADAARLVEPTARQQGVAITTRWQGEAPLEADGDALHQVVVNLLTNALQAMPQGGKLAISLERKEDQWLIAVRDTGKGIAEADLPHLFEPFFTTKTQGDHTRRGSGLGLSVSYGIVQAHGGRIEVASTLGQGATFTVLLPLLAPGKEGR